PVSFVCTLPATPAITPLSLPDALPISRGEARRHFSSHRLVRFPKPLPPLRMADDDGPAACVGKHAGGHLPGVRPLGLPVHVLGRSEEHTSELQSRENLVCRLLLEKKKI